MDALHYFIQVNIYLVLFYAFFVLFLRNETYHQLNRWFLISAAFAAVVIPALRANWFLKLINPQPIKDGWQQLNLVIEQGYNAQFLPNEQLQTGDFVIAVYGTVVSVLLLRFILRLFSIKKLRKETGYQAYSFFNTIKINQPGAQKEVILNHEKVHVKQMHSLDVICFEIFAIINWFNPVIYFYRSAIKHIHEFIADEIAVKTMPDKASYATLLLSYQLQVKPHILTNNFFNHNLLKRRINMLVQTKSTKKALLKYGLSLPLFLMVILLSSAAINDNKTVLKLSESITPSGNLSRVVEPIITNIIPAEKLPKTSAKNKSLTKKNSLNTQRKNELINATATESIITKPVDTTTTDNNEVFTNVEGLPSFPGGLSAWGKFLGTNIKYPAEERKKGIEGRVIVNMIIEEDGSLSNIKVVRGENQNFNEEALRVVKMSPKWQPGIQNGKNVNTNFTTPINFSLGKITGTGQINPENKEKKSVNIVSTQDGQVNNMANVSLPADKQPLYIINGKEITAEKMNKISPNDIASINVVKDKTAIEKYGKKGKNGVVIITLKEK